MCVKFYHRTCTSVFDSHSWTPLQLRMYWQNARNAFDVFQKFHSEGYGHTYLQRCFSFALKYTEFRTVLYRVVVTHRTIQQLLYTNEGVILLLGVKYYILPDMYFKWLVVEKTYTIYMLFARSFKHEISANLLDTMNSRWPTSDSSKCCDWVLICNSDTCSRIAISMAKYCACFGYEEGIMYERVLLCFARFIYGSFTIKAVSLSLVAISCDGWKILRIVSKTAIIERENHVSMNSCKHCNSARLVSCWRT